MAQTDRSDYRPAGMTRGPMRPEELRRYADMIMKGCIALRRDDVVIVRPSLAHRELAVALAEAAYRGGAVVVEVEYDDAAGRGGADRARLTRGADHARAVARRRDAGARRRAGRARPGHGRVRGDGHRQASARARGRGRLGRSHGNRTLSRIRREGRLRGTICALADRRMGDARLPRARRRARRSAGSRGTFSRSAGSGPATRPGHKGWTDHLAALRRRAARLTKLDLKELHVLDDGTDLRLRIAPHSLWRGGGETDHWGRRIAMNVPTEECFISPDAAATEGTFRCSRPRSIGGRMIEGFSGEFRGGRLVRLAAKRDRRPRLVRALPRARLPDADRLGEIALVDSSSRIGQTGRIYYNGLLDENAAAHMAFGSGFAKTRTVPIGRSRHGVNRSRRPYRRDDRHRRAERLRHHPNREARRACPRRRLAVLNA